MTCTVTKNLSVRKQVFTLNCSVSRPTRREMTENRLQKLYLNTKRTNAMLILIKMKRGSVLESFIV